jgi:hypothetical protein
LDDRKAAFVKTDPNLHAKPEDEKKLVPWRTIFVFPVILPTAGRTLVKVME